MGSNAFSFIVPVDTDAAPKKQSNFLAFIAELSAVKNGSDFAFRGFVENCPGPCGPPIEFSGLGVFRLPISAASALGVRPALAPAVSMFM